MSAEVKEAASSTLEGKTIVISGTFSISRDDMKALIEANGGKNGSSVSSKTSYLLAGDKPGPEKVKKAQDLGIEIIDEAKFMALLPEGVDSPESLATLGRVRGRGPEQAQSAGAWEGSRSDDSGESTPSGNDIIEPTLF